MKDCRTCINCYYIDGGQVYCEINVPNDVFELDCEHAECPYWEEEE